MERYEHQKIEQKWRKRWADAQVYKTTEDPNKEKFYILDMFPYPSGEGLHVGHPKGYIATDVISRYKRMAGYNVLHPMGWDAFGLPAEQYALKNKVHPRVAVDKNIKRYKEQLEAISLDYDWDREIATTDPAFYKWTQWAFIQMFKKGLVFQSNEPINWCPSCKTGLANEDLEDGACERCDTPIEKKTLPQWVIKITDYADRLLADLDKLEWQEHIKESQRNWIGRSEGAEIIFKIKKQKAKSAEKNVVLVHGCPSNEKKAMNPETRTYDKHWFLWTKEQLEKRGFHVDFPLMPHPWKPSYAEHKKEFEKSAITENTTLIGTSCGAAFLLRWLGETKQKVKTLILVAPAKSTAKDHPLATFYDFDIDTEIKKRVDNIIIFTSDSDTQERMDFAASLSHTLDAKLVRIAGYGHYLEKHMGKTDFPELMTEIDVIEKNVNNDDELLITNDELPVTNLTVFTTRPDTLFGATYMVLAPEHRLVAELKDEIENIAEVEQYQKEAQKKTEIERTAEGREKTGVKLEGIVAVNPANGAEIPVYIADYVLTDYGTGAIMAVPAHDERDYAFAKKYDIDMLPVIASPNNLRDFDGEKVHFSEEVRGNDGKQYFVFSSEVYVGDGILVNSGTFDGMNSEQAKEEIIAWLEKEGMGKKTVSYKLRDWVFARQRYWGEPIPLIHCDACGVVPVPEEELPLTLPEVESYEPTGTGESPLAAIDEWVNTTCPECGGSARRETNTMPQWAGSSWYHLRYIDPHNDTALVDKKKEAYWSPVDFYVGGAEHATRHLIYARFWHKFLYDIGAVHDDEPYKKLQTVGLILAEDGRKMSKRWGNVVNPDDVIARFGSDTFRLYEMFMGPFDASIAWSMEGLVGPRKFLEKIWKIYHNGCAEKTSDEITRLLHKTIKKVGDDISEMKYNTAIAQMMIFVNALEKNAAITQDDFGHFLKILSPFAPHMTQELWGKMGHDTFLIHESWPTYDETYITDDTVTIAVQVNGKVRGTITVPVGTTQDDVAKHAHACEGVARHISNKTIRKTIFVPDKIINFVVG